MLMFARVLPSTYAPGSRLEELSLGRGFDFDLWRVQRL